MVALLSGSLLPLGLEVRRSCDCRIHFHSSASIFFFTFLFYYHNLSNYFLSLLLPVVACFLLRSLPSKQAPLFRNVLRVKKMCENPIDPYLS